MRARQVRQSHAAVITWLSLSLLPLIKLSNCQPLHALSPDLDTRSRGSLLSNVIKKIKCRSFDSSLQVLSLIN